jgi:mRNA interferase RelE/StbE
VGSYKLVLKQSAAKELEDLPGQERRRIVDRIKDLADDPRPPGCEKLSGRERYRIRQGDYRVLYEINDPDRLVTLVKIGHRREVYR